MNKRDFLKLVFALTGLASLVPFLPYSQFFSYGSNPKIERKKIANISQLKPHSFIIFLWPTETHPYHTNILIRGPGGGVGPTGDLVAYNRVCTHLQCLVNYDPETDQLPCPCHGSIYNALNGNVVSGPAQKALPKIDLEVDANGDIYAVNIEGEIGVGR